MQHRSPLPLPPLAIQHVLQSAACGGDRGRARVGTSSRSLPWPCGSIAGCFPSPALQQSQLRPHGRRTGLATAQAWRSKHLKEGQRSCAAHPRHVHNVEQALLRCFHFTRQAGPHPFPLLEHVQVVLELHCLRPREKATGACQKERRRCHYLVGRASARLSPQRTTFQPKAHGSPCATKTEQLQHWVMTPPHSLQPLSFVHLPI